MNPTIVANTVSTFPMLAIVITPTVGAYATFDFTCIGTSRKTLAISITNNFASDLMGFILIVVTITVLGMPCGCYANV